MKFSTQAAIAAVAAALLATPVLAQTKTGPLPPTGSPSDYQNAPGSTGSTQRSATTRKSATKSSPATKDVSRQEYLDQAAKRFDAMDTNHDGMVNNAERRSFDSKQRAARSATTPKATSAPKPPTSSSSMSTSPSSSSGSRAISPPAMSSDKPIPNNSGSAPKPADTPAKM